MAQSQAQPEYVDTLKKERDRFVALAFCAADMLFEVDKDQTITYVAGATKALTDYEPHDVIGKPFVDLIDSAERDNVTRRLEGLGSANRLEWLMLRVKRLMYSMVYKFWCVTLYRNVSHPVSQFYETIRREGL